MLTKPLEQTYYIIDFEGDFSGRKNGLQGTTWSEERTLDFLTNSL